MGGIKLDMSKSFDRIEWSFLKDILSQLGIHKDWIQLIDQCISTATISILLNGVSGETFKPTRSLRQGDPLSPYLFILCMEAFSCILYNAESQRKIYGIKATRSSPSISHLCFADDILLFLKARPAELRYLQSLLDQFSNASGQVVNLQKSAIFFNKKLSRSVCIQYAQILQMKSIGLGEKYLGLPLLMSRSRTQNCSFLRDKMQSKLQGWEGKMLTQAARSTQLQSVLGTMPLYLMHCLKVPQQTINNLDKVQRNYWWNHNASTRPRHYKNWSSLCLPKRYGGLGFKNLSFYNSALLTKMAWKLLHNQNSLWGKLLRSKSYLIKTC